MAKTLLLHTIGNRDWQFNKDIGTNEIRSLLEQNPENEKFLVPIKSITIADKYKLIFRDNTQQLVEIYNGDTPATQELHKHHAFPMLTAACAYVLQKESHIDELWLIATDQVPEHGSDTVHVAPIAEKVIKEQFTTPAGKTNIKTVEVSCLKTAFHKEKTDEELYGFFHSALRQKHLQGFEKMYFSCKSGVPDVTNILQILALREENCVFLKHKVNPKNGETYTEEMYAFPIETKSWKQ